METQTFGQHILSTIRRSTQKKQRLLSYCTTFCWIKDGGTSKERCQGRAWKITPRLQRCNDGMTSLFLTIPQSLVKPSPKKGYSFNQYKCCSNANKWTFLKRPLAIVVVIAVNMHNNNSCWFCYII